MNGMQVLENHMIGTRDAFEWCADESGRKMFLVVHSLECLAQMNAGVVWHDHRQHCPSWTDAAECRCDVEGR